MANETVEMSGFNPPSHWKRLDVSDVNSWPASPLTWIIEWIIAYENLVLVVAETQTGKTLLALAMALAIATKQKFLGRFTTLQAKVLYLALEDPVRRIKERLCDMKAEVGPNLFETYFASGLNLGEEDHKQWLEKIIVKAGCQVVFLDTYQRATGGLSSFDDQKQSLILHGLSDLTRKHNIAIVVLDHVRKTSNRGDKRKRVTIDDIKGTGGKAQNADAVILLERADNRTVKFRCFSKETDKQVALQYAVSAQGSHEEKFQLIADLSDNDGSHHVNSDPDLHLLLTKLGPSWLSNGELVTSTGLSSATVRRKLKPLVKDGSAETNGKRGKYTRYRRVETGVRLLPGRSSSIAEMTN